VVVSRLFNFRAVHHRGSGSMPGPGGVGRQAGVGDRQGTKHEVRIVRVRRCTPHAHLVKRAPGQAQRVTNIRRWQNRHPAPVPPGDSGYSEFLRAFQTKTVVVSAFRWSARGWLCSGRGSWVVISDSPTWLRGNPFKFATGSETIACPKATPWASGKRLATDNSTTPAMSQSFRSRRPCCHGVAGVDVRPLPR
jgi:hypothetical protein